MSEGKIAILKPIDIEILNDIYEMDINNGEQINHARYNLVENEAKHRLQELACSLLKMERLGYIEFDGKSLLMGGQVSKKYRNNVIGLMPEKIHITEKGINLINTQLYKKDNMKIFLAYSYRPEDEKLAREIIKVLEQNNFNVIDGKADRLGSISVAILDKIKESDISLIFMTKRDKKENGKYSTVAWLLEEKGAALAYEKDVAIFVEEGIDESDIGGLQGDGQLFHFNRDNYFAVIEQFINILKKTPK